ncbi:MAG: VOC family protein [bacterium]|nr:VOC family protein [bacterium]
MLTRFDHAVIAVPDLDAAVSAYRGMGFEVTLGGRHPDRGSHNAIIRFGLTYLELISVHDHREAIESGESGRVLVDYLARGGGLAGFVLAGTAIADQASRIRKLGLAAELVAMRRARPDGSSFSWRIVAPGGVQWRRPWPFLIEWETPDAERLRSESPGVHANGACGVSTVGIAVRDLDAALPLYRDALLLAEGGSLTRSDLRAYGRRFVIGETDLHLLAPDGEGPLAVQIAERGEGPFELSLRFHPPTAGSGDAR